MSYPYCPNCGVFTGNPAAHECEVCGIPIENGNIIYSNIFRRPETIACTNEEGKLGRLLKFVKKHFDKKV